MDYEQKYKEALERARYYHSKDYMLINSAIEEIFPELKEKESEDERIKKAIHIYLDWLDGRKDYAPKGIYSIKDMIAWLEKQGKKKPANKVEPKFKVSDWIIATGEVVYQIKDIQEDIQANVTLVEPNGDESIFDISVLDNAKLWTIHNAKDGDVLVDEDNNIGLYLEEKDEEKDDLYWHSCIYLGCDGYIHGFKTGGYHYYKNTKPATKEQRDLLFQKMKEAGYEWDGEKKELKKIELKKLDADNVWLQNYISNVTRLVNQLKKRFRTMTQEEFFYQCMDIIEHWLNGNRKLSDLRGVTDKLYNKVTKPHWISVEDELPKINPNGSEWEYSDDVLVALKDGSIAVGRYERDNSTGEHYWMLYGVDKDLVVTHWIHKPQAPVLSNSEKTGKNHFIDANNMVDHFADISKMVEKGGKE